MEGVVEVVQIDDTQVHWVAEIAGSATNGTLRSSSRSPIA